MKDDITIQKEFGAFLREHRKRKDLFQADVAERAGITQVYYSAIECGTRQPKFALVLKLCDILDADLKEFVAQYIEE